jgi:hypothetical protein
MHTRIAHRLLLKFLLADRAMGNSELHKLFLGMSALLNQVDTVLDAIEWTKRTDPCDANVTTVLERAATLLAKSQQMYESIAATRRWLSAIQAHAMRT